MEKKRKAVAESEAEEEGLTAAEVWAWASVPIVLSNLGVLRYKALA